MAKTILQKLSDKIVPKVEQGDSLTLDAALDEKLPVNQLLDEHLEIIGAAFADSHSSFHGSHID